MAKVYRNDVAVKWDNGEIEGICGFGRSAKTARDNCARALQKRQCIYALKENKVRQYEFVDVEDLTEEQREKVYVDFEQAYDCYLELQFEKYAS